MSQFIESICFLDGKPQLIPYHQNRVNRTFTKFFPNNTAHNLASLIPIIPDTDKFKCRVVYDGESIDVQFISYQARNVESLRIVESIELPNYSYKYSERIFLDNLYEQRGHYDDIIIVNREGEVTDSYYANLAFFDGEQWFTSDTPLLNGVKRQYLLDQGLLRQQKILKTDIKKFEKVSLINAMLYLGEIEIFTEKIDL